MHVHSFIDLFINFLLIASLVKWMVGGTDAEDAGMVGCYGNVQVSFVEPNAVSVHLSQVFHSVYAYILSQCCWYVVVSE